MSSFILNWGKYIVIFGAVDALILGLGYLFTPNIMSALGNPVRIIPLEDRLLENRKAVGSVFLAISVLLFSIYYMF